MGIRIIPPSTRKERRARLQALAALCQEGLGVGCLAKLFWTMAAGLELNNAEHIDIFNECLDFTLPLWEIEVPQPIKPVCVCCSTHGERRVCHNTSKG